ncbi:MAG: hypothetical protein AABZ77_07770 [Chloroflexota bacterium]
MKKLRKWFKEDWGSLLIILALILLAVALSVNPSDFVNLAWYALVALTAVYAYATLKVVIATSKQTEETRRMIDEMRQSRLDAVKPSLSLQPENFTFGGSFSALYLMNSGGVAKDVRIDIEVTNPASRKGLFVPAINREHKVYLQVGGEVQDKGGLITINVNFNDSYNQNFTESLSIDFSELKKEGRAIWGQYSELDGIKRILEQIERKTK